MDLSSVTVWLLTILTAVVGGFLVGSAGSSTRQKRKRVQSPLAPCEPPTASDSSVSLSPSSPLLERVLPGEVEAEESMEGRNMVVAAFNLPISLRKEGEEWKVSWNSERDVFRNFEALRGTMNVKFVGCPPEFVPLEDREAVEDALNEFDCFPVFLEKDVHERFFSGFCKGVLWPLFHYFTPSLRPGFAKKWDSLWQTYNSVNMIFAKQLSLITDEEDDTIWIHNYHLLLLPSFVRKKLPRAKIGIFIHTPFPTSDLYRCLPGRSSILRALLCADLIGFQTYDYARHFISSLKRVLDIDFQTMPGGALGVIYCGRSVTIRINHVGIRSELFREMALSENVKEKVTSIKETFLQRQIILAVDELDPVKGIICKIQAYALFLERYPEFIDRVILLIVIWPSSVCEDEQKELHQQILEEVNGIISNFGPEVVQIMDGANLTVEDLVSYYASADIGLFATFWDGLNICPYEFTACQNSDSPGSLIVSEFMGCSRSLSGVSTINPWRLEQVSEALFANLSLSPGQRRAHHQRRFNYVMKHKFHDWVNGFLKDLDEASCQSRNLNFVQVGWGTNVRLIGLHSGFSHLEEQDIIPSYRASSQRLLLLDYDGTLSAESNAELARPSEQVLKVLRILSEDPHNIVFILSGRERKVLDDWFAPVPNLGLAAEKGVYYKWPNSKNWLNAVTVKNFEWKKATKHLMEAYTERTDGSYIEPKESAIVWHYEAADPEYGKMQASELAKYLQKVLEGWPVVEVMRYDYNRILEVKPKGVSKGFTTLRILKQLQKQKRMPQFVFAVGDDRSDEEVFGCLIDALKAGLPKSPVEHKGDDIHLPTGQGPHRSRNLITETIPEGEYHLFTSCVGIKPSNAAFYLNDPQDVVDILTSLSVVSAKYLRRAQAQKQETEGSAT